MYIDLTKTDQALNEEFDISFNELLQDFNYNGKEYSFNKFCFSGKYLVLEGEIKVFGEIECNLRTFCDRCLEHASFDLAVDFDENFKRNVQNEEVYSYESRKIELDKPFMDNILLNIPLYVYCKDDCKGICEYCGANLNINQCECEKENKKASSPFSVLGDLFDKEV